LKRPLVLSNRKIGLVEGKFEIRRKPEWWLGGCSNLILPCKIRRNSKKPDTVSIRDSNIEVVWQD